MTMHVGIPNDKIALVLAQIAKRERATPDAIAERFLMAGLKAERQRIVTEQEANGQPVLDTCTEAFLRQICGDQWEACWWLSTCALGNPT